jgi:hypothetical protein
MEAKLLLPLPKGLEVTNIDVIDRVLTISMLQREPATRTTTVSGVQAGPWLGSMPVCWGLRGSVGSATTCPSLASLSLMRQP